MMKWPQHTTFNIWGKIDFGEDGCVKPKTNKFQYFFIISISKVKQQDSSSTEGAQVVGKGRKVEVGAWRTFGITGCPKKM